MSTTAERVRALIVPLVEAAELDLYDLNMDGGVLSVLVDRPDGADIDAIAKLARSISRALDEHDPIDGHYTLEVGSPGLERPLRTPEHFARSIGSTVKVKTKPGTEGERRVDGTITAADDATVTIRSDAGDERTLHHDEIERARTTFEWGAAPKPSKPSKPEKKTRSSKP
jgi:ribosome maturation factor RimP